MEWIEIIQLKSFTGKYRDDAAEAFCQLSSPVWEKDLQEISLFRSPTMNRELGIIITWKDNAPINGKSGLGLQLAAAFAEFGHIYHHGWLHSSKLIIHSNVMEA